MELDELLSRATAGRAQLAQCAWCRRVRGADGGFATRATTLLLDVQHVICGSCSERMLEQAWLKQVTRTPVLEREAASVPASITPMWPMARRQARGAARAARLRRAA